MRQLWRRLWYVLRQRRLEAELEEELEHHRELTRAALQADGTDPTAIERATSRAIGNALLPATRLVTCGSGHGCTAPPAMKIVAVAPSPRASARTKMDPVATLRRD